MSRPGMSSTLSTAFGHRELFSEVKAAATWGWSTTTWGVHVKNVCVVTLPLPHLSLYHKCLIYIYVFSEDCPRMPKHVREFIVKTDFYAWLITISRNKHIVINLLHSYNINFEYVACGEECVRMWSWPNYCVSWYFPGDSEQNYGYTEISIAGFSVKIWTWEQPNAQQRSRSWLILMPLLIKMFVLMLRSNMLPHSSGRMNLVTVIFWNDWEKGMCPLCSSTWYNRTGIAQSV